MWAQKIEYVDGDTEAVPPPLVKKQIWDAGNQEFVSVKMYRFQGVLNRDKLDWLGETYGPPGVYKNGKFWDYTRAGNFTVMDEQVYTWYQMKWGNK
jgi:hypothetical protein